MPLISSIPVTGRTLDIIEDRKDLDNEKTWYDFHLRRYFTCVSYIDYLYELSERRNNKDCDDNTMFDSLVILEMLDNYEIYQNLLKLIDEKHSDYKRELNRWLDYIFDTHNSYYQATAKNFKKEMVYSAPLFTLLYNQI